MFHVEQLLIMDNIKYIIERSCVAGLKIDEIKAAQLNTFYEMLVEKNKVMNLTGITGFEDVVLKHFIDSVMNVQIKGDETMIDVGTGAGFPGIPLKIVYPDLKVTLMDSLNKRLLFLDEVIAELKLTDIYTCHARAEDLGHDKNHRERYDLAVSRAVANLSSLCEYCMPFVKKGGTFISYKSDAAEELTAASRAIRTLGGAQPRVETFLLPGTDMKRTLIYIPKSAQTPNTYPRKAPLPSKQPL